MLCQLKKWKFILGLLSVLLASLQTAVAEENPKEKNVDTSIMEYFHKIQPTSRSGSEHYRKGQYKQAYNKLSFMAVRGFKQSQYLLGIMYLKGQHVEQSVLKGMSWLGVANESKLSKDWLVQFQQIYNKLSSTQQSIINSSVTEYINKYGTLNNGVSCDRKLSGVSRKILVQCVKEEGFYRVYSDE